MGEVVCCYGCCPFVGNSVWERWFGCCGCCPFVDDIVWRGGLVVVVVVRLSVTVPGTGDSQVLRVSVPPVFGRVSAKTRAPGELLAMCCHL